MDRPMEHPPTILVPRDGAPATVAASRTLVLQCPTHHQPLPDRRRRGADAGSRQARGQPGHTPMPAEREAGDGAL
jgi:hypothetical protein